MSSLIVGPQPVVSLFPPARTSGRKFLNTVPTSVMRPVSMFRLVHRMMVEKRVGDPIHVPGPFHTDPAIYSSPPASGLRVTWIGHSSLLIEVDGVRILTDPIWSSRASVVSFAGPERFYAPPLVLEDLPPLDAVLLSHDHYDHLDRNTIHRLRAMGSGLQFICSLGIGRYLESWGVAREQIAELNWGQTAFLTSGRASCRITATPACHFSGRGLWSRNETLWSSFVLRTKAHNLFFSGDSGMFPGFQKIGERMGPFDLTMIEIGAYDNDWPDVHMGPEKATEAHRALKGKLLLPIHWGLFNLAFHPWREPIERLTAMAEWKKIPLVLPKPGTPTEITGTSLNTFWWES